MDVETIRQSYKELTSQKVVEIATYEAGHLSKEARDIVIEEIHRRGLSERLLEVIKLAGEELTDEKFTFYLELIRNLPDPHTKAMGEKLNATVVSLSYGIPLYGCKTKKSLYFGTAENIVKKIDETNKITIASGWLGLPFGIYSYVNSILHNSKVKKINYHDEPSEVLIEFVKANLGFIEMNKDYPEILSKLLIQAMN